MQLRSIILCLSVLLPCSLQAQQEDADSLKARDLPELTVQSHTQIETPQKAVLLPTRLQKKHAANGLELLEIMQIPDLEISVVPPSISSSTRGEVVVCMNGQEVQPEEIRTLRANKILRMEYTRTPTGRYAGKAGVLNFITDTLDAGGNIYLSSIQSFGYSMGNYLAFADYTKNKKTISFTLFHDWSLAHNFREGNDHFRFSDGSLLHREEQSLSARQKEFMQGGRVKFSVQGKRYTFSSALQLLREEIPDEYKNSLLIYSGKTEHKSQRTSGSDSRKISPSAYIDYKLQLPHDQSFSLIANVSCGRNRYNSIYAEEQQDSLFSRAKEHNFIFSGSAQYDKTFSNGITLTGSLFHTYKNYSDTYSGSSTGDQHLITHESMGLAQISQSLDHVFYYLSAGASNMAVNLNDDRQNYFNPVAFYGGTYTFNEQHAVTLNGLYTHTWFDPSNKNAMVIPVSFFESQVGNPNIRPLKVFDNTFSYSGTFGASKIKAEYDNYIYFNNIVNQYVADENRVYLSRVNDGNFYGNMFFLSYSYALLQQRLNFNISGIYEYDMLAVSSTDCQKTFSAGVLR